MATVDTNSVIRAYLVVQAGIIASVGTKVYAPRAPEDAVLPFITFFSRGGVNNPYIPPMMEPSVQFDCWADSPRSARAVYGALYDALQGVQRQVVDVDGTDYIIWSAVEEIQGQDIVDVEILGYFRTLTFFKFVIKAE